MRKRLVSITITLILSVMLIGVISVSSIAIAKETIKFMAVADPFFYALRDLIPEFEKETGIRVIPEGLAYDAWYSKALLDFSSHTANYDVVGVDTPVVSEWGEAGYLVDLGPYIAKDRAELNVDDLIGVNAGRWRGTQFCLPLAGYVMLLHFRKDLFPKYGLIVPVTWKDYYNVGEKLVMDTNGDGKTDFWGTAFGCKRGVCVTQFWEQVYFTFGGKFFRDFEKGDYYPLLDEPIAQEATEFFHSLLKIAPPDVVNYDWFDVGEAMASGKVGMIYHWDVYSQTFENPEKSKVVGKVGWAKPPLKEGSGVVPTQAAPWTFGINKDSKHKEASWKFMKWVVSEEIQRKMAETGKLTSPIRLSVLNNPALQNKYPVLRAQYNALLGGSWVVPYMPKYAEIQDKVLGLRLNQMLIGEISVKKALELAQKEALRILGFK